MRVKTLRLQMSECSPLAPHELFRFSPALGKAHGPQESHEAHAVGRQPRLRHAAPAQQGLEAAQLIKSHQRSQDVQTFSHKLRKELIKRLTFNQLLIQLTFNSIKF